MTNRLRDFFYGRTEGQGIWKWDHYFDVYERHFSKFRDKEVHILEIGIYSGGSLEMWKDYFGINAMIYGVDIEPACSAYEQDSVKIFIGDQADPFFWQKFKNDVPLLDIVVDDGGHMPEQQRVSLDQLLPHIRRGGVYCCEDVHADPNEFASYVHSLSHKLNDNSKIDAHPEDNRRRYLGPTTPFQAEINSIHLYPYMTIFEKNSAPLQHLTAPKQGTLWQPYLV